MLPFESLKASQKKIWQGRNAGGKMKMLLYSYTMKRGHRKAFFLSLIEVVIPSTLERRRYYDIDQGSKQTKLDDRGILQEGSTREGGGGCHS